MTKMHEISGLEASGLEALIVAAGPGSKCWPVEEFYKHATSDSQY